MMSFEDQIWHHPGNWLPDFIFIFFSQLSPIPFGSLPRISWFPSPAYRLLLPLLHQHFWCPLWYTLSSSSVFPAALSFEVLCSSSFCIRCPPTSSGYRHTVVTCLPCTIDLAFLYLPFSHSPSHCWYAIPYIFRHESVNFYSFWFWRLLANLAVDTILLTMDVIEIVVQFYVERIVHGESSLFNFSTTGRALTANAEVRETILSIAYDFPPTTVFYQCPIS